MSRESIQDGRVEGPFYIIMQPNFKLGQSKKKEMLQIYYTGLNEV